MKKYILLLLIITGFTQAQTLQNPTFGNTTTNTLKVKSATTVTTTPNLTTTEIDGTQAKIVPDNIPITATPINYAPSTPALSSHLGAIDTRLGQISSTSAGITQRVYFTADNTTITAGTFFTSSLTGKGTTPSGSPPALVLGDNTKGYFTKDVISSGFAATTIAYAGTYSGNLTVSASPTPNATQQRFTIEIYKTDNSGNPIASGVPGAPTGNLGVTVLAILDSGVTNLVAGAITNVPVSGILTQNTTLNTGERLRYHVSATKVGVGGGSVTFGVYYGNAYNSYYDVAVAVTTDAVVNKVPGLGITSTDALNTLNSTKANDSDVIHKLGDLFANSSAFDPMLAQDNFKNIKIREISPESYRFDPSLSPIYGWGDSMTDGFGSVNYPTQLTSILSYAVTNKGVGGETSTQIKNRFLAEPANFPKSVIIWAGRNNYTSPTTVKADIATIISNLGHTRYLVVGIVNASTEPKNSTAWTDINALNADLKVLYGKKYVPIREYLISKYNPLIPQDVTDFNNDVTPTSIRITSDPLHLNTLGNKYVAEYFNKYLGNMFDSEGYLQSKDFKYYFDRMQPQKFAKVVFVNSTNPGTATIFDLSNPPVTNDNALKSDTANLYIGSDASNWVYNSMSATYTTYSSISPETSNFYLYGSTNDASNNKVARIYRPGVVSFEKITSTSALVPDMQLVGVRASLSKPESLWISGSNSQINTQSYSSGSGSVFGFLHNSYEDASGVFRQLSNGNADNLGGGRYDFVGDGQSFRWSVTPVYANGSGKDNSTTFTSIMSLNRAGHLQLIGGSNSRLTTVKVILNTSPVSSTGNYEELTRNTSTGEVEKSPIKKYTALISQTGTGAPTVTVLGSNTVGTIVWTRSTSGFYFGTLSGAFPAGKTFFTITPSSSSASYAMFRNTDNQIVIRTQDNSTVPFTDADDKLFSNSIRIEVYP